MLSYSEKLDNFLKKIDYQFNNAALLREALTHPSSSQDGVDYQRLEFLGDAVLSIVIAEFLIKKYPEENEGQLSKRQAYLVSGQLLSEIAEVINVGEVLKLSEGERSIGGKANKRNLENALEALIGAIYLDSNLEKARQFILQNWQETLNKNVSPPKDAVSYLQEIVQAKSKKLPEYIITKTGGNQHHPVFTAALNIDDKKYQAQGSSKKEAQKNVAEVVLVELGVVNSKNN